MKTKTFKALSLIVALLVAVAFTVGYVFAWFVNRRDSDLKINGTSAGAYFDSGNGSEETPFVIANPTHMHNLAVLQNSGKFVDRDGNPKKYYFEIKKTVDEIDMSGRYIPPIGNDKNPFIGDFNGNGKTLANLQVTTNKELLKEEYPRHAEATYEFSQAVGLFGMTGETSDIHNVILENPSVDVSAKNTLYSAKKNAVAGLAVGFVAGKCSSVGVRAKGDGSALSVNVEHYSTFNSILGALGDNVSSAVTGGGYTHGSGGSGNAFGASFDVEGMYDRLVAIDGNNNMAWRLPELDTEKNDGYTLATHEKLPFTVTSDSTYEGADATEVIGNSNIGYLLGNQNKVYNKNVKFGDKLIAPGGTNVTNWHFPDGSTPAERVDGKSNKTIPRWIYRITVTDVGSDTYNEYTGFSPLSDAEYNALSGDILELIPSENGTVNGFNSIRLSQTYNNAGIQIYTGSTVNGQWTPHGQISWMGKTYGEGYTMGNYSDPAVDENGIRYTEDGRRLDEYGYIYDEDGFVPDSDDWTLKIYSVDADGNAKNENGEYYFGYKLVWNGDYIYGLLDGDGYYYNEDGYFIKDFPYNVYSKDAQGYALDPNGKYYDVSGGLADASGFVIDGNGGYYADVSDIWPLSQYGIDEDGYYSQNGERYLDDAGLPVKAYGYGLATNDGTNYYLINADGSRATFKQYGGNRELPAKKATRVKVMTGEDLIASMNGAYVKAKAGSSVEFFRYTRGIALPNCGVWFKPSQAGKLRFVMYTEKAGDGFTLIKGTRTNATKDNPFYVDYNKNGKDVTVVEVAKYKMPSWVLFYFEYEVKQEDIDAGNVEYWLMQYGNNGAYFVYLDMGASAAEDTSGIDREKSVSAVDFIYDGVEIKQGDPADDAADALIKVGDFIVKTSGEEANYESSKTSVYFDDLEAILNLVFLRLYSGSEGHSDKTKTICLEKSNPVPDTNSEVKATFATYVCPTIGGGSGTVSGSGGGGGTVTPTPDPGPDPDPTPTETVTQTADISGAKSANDVLLTVTDADGNTIATATILCTGGAKTGGSIDDGNGNTETGVAHIQTSGSPCLEFVLAEGYTYTITVYAGSSGAGTRNITLNDTQQETGAGNVCKAVTWDNLTNGTYSCTTSGNIRIARIVITATPN